MPTWSKALMTLICLCAIAGCKEEPAPPPTDEAWLRSELHIPDAAKRVTVQADPAGMGMAGREALRIFAAFEMTREDFDNYRKQFRPADWQPLPMATQVNYFNEGPTELSRFTSNGFYFCDVATADATDRWQPVSTAGAANRIERYRVLLLDTASSQLHVVYKQYH